MLCVFFFFQAEDGIRDYKVTGVQTCALPIFVSAVAEQRVVAAGAFEAVVAAVAGDDVVVGVAAAEERLAAFLQEQGLDEIGRASCRGKGEILVVAGSFKKKKREERATYNARQ